GRAGRRGDARGSRVPRGPWGQLREADRLRLEQGPADDRPELHRPPAASRAGLPPGPTRVARPRPAISPAPVRGGRAGRQSLPERRHAVTVLEQDRTDAAGAHLDDAHAADIEGVLDQLDRELI